MSMRPYAMGAAALVLLLGLSFSPAAARTQSAEPQAQPSQPAPDTQEVPPPPPPPAEAPAAEQAPAADAAVAACSDCHEQAGKFTANPHARGRLDNGQVPNAVCESCHGKGNAHIEAGGDPTLIVKPAGRKGADICLGCHDLTTDQVSRHSGTHANSETVNCLTCHSIHNSQPLAPHLLWKKETALCSSCHATQGASLRNKPYGHRLGRGGMECTSCHEPHGRPMKGMTRKTVAGEDLPCFACHADKRGPFVFPHGGVEVGTCVACHDVHGSSYPKSLKRARVDQLCLECHSPLTTHTLGSQPPSFHNLSQVRYQNCTSCHVAIHGSNSSPVLFK